MSKKEINSKNKNKESSVKISGVAVIVGIITVSIIGGVLLLKGRAAIISAKQNKETIAELDNASNETTDSLLDDSIDSTDKAMNMITSDEDVPADAKSVVQEFLEKHKDELEIYGLTVDEAAAGTISLGADSTTTYIIDCGDYVITANTVDNILGVTTKNEILGVETSDDEDIYFEVLELIANNESSLVPANITGRALTEKLANKEYAIEKTDEEGVYKIDYDGTMIYFDHNNNTITVDTGDVKN